MVMENPFRYSKFVIGSSFCNREREQKELLEFIRSSQNPLLYSHRRLGKSSLIKQVFATIQTRQPDIAAVYIDLYGTTTEKEFIQRGFQQLSSLESNTDKLLKLLKAGMDKLSFQVSVDPATQMHAIAPSFREADAGLMLGNFMGLLEKFSKKQKLVVAFDEFQEITKYTNAESFEKRLRSHIQGHTNICYIFSGSRQHLLTAMFSRQDRAFYQQAASFPLQKIAAAHFVPWLSDRFQTAGLVVGAGHLEKIVERFENHPMYIQLFCFFLCAHLRDHHWSDDLIFDIEEKMLLQKQPEYQVLWDNLSINQKKTLKLVLANDGTGLFAATALEAAGIKTASMATRCLKTLSEKEILVKNGNYRIQDILLKKWIARFC